VDSEVADRHYRATTFFMAETGVNRHLFFQTSAEPLAALLTDPPPIQHQPP